MCAEVSSKQGQAMKKGTTKKTEKKAPTAKKSTKKIDTKKKDAIMDKLVGKKPAASEPIARVIRPTAKKMSYEEAMEKAKEELKEIALPPQQKVLLDQTVAFQNIIKAVNETKIEKIAGIEKKMFQRTHRDLVRVKESKGGRSIAKDSCESFSFMDAQFKPNLSYEIISKFSQTFIGWQNCAILKQNPFIDKACSIPPQDAMANGYKLSFTRPESGEKGGKKKDKELLAELLARSQKEYKIKDICVRAAINKRVFGYSLVVPTFKSNMNMEAEFDIDAVKKDDYTGMTVVEPFWLTYDFDEKSLLDASSRHFYEPTWYVVGGKDHMKKIHRSWCIKLINSPVPDVLKPTYYFGGIPLTQQIYEAVYAYEKALNELILLLLTKRTLIMDAEIANYMANPEEVKAKLVAFSELRDNFAVAIKELGYDIKQIETTLTGLEEIVNALFQRVSAIASMPVPKLLKTALKGFNSTGEYEEKDYKQSLKREQETDYVPILDFHNRLMTKSDYGREMELTVVFNPTDTPTESEKAEIRYKDSTTMTHRLASQVTTQEEERRKLAEDPYMGFSDIDPEDVPEIDEETFNSLYGTEKNNKGIPEPKEKQGGLRGKSKEDLEEENE